jgi:hypothetical protein
MLTVSLGLDFRLSYRHASTAKVSTGFFVDGGE